MKKFLRILAHPPAGMIWNAILVAFIFAVCSGGALQNGFTDMGKILMVIMVLSLLYSMWSTLYFITKQTLSQLKRLRLL